MNPPGTAKMFEGRTRRRWEEDEKEQNESKYWLRVSDKVDRIMLMTAAAALLSLRILQCVS